MDMYEAYGFDKQDVIQNLRARYAFMYGEIPAHTSVVFFERRMRNASVVFSWNEHEVTVYRKPKIVPDGHYVKVETMGEVARLTPLESRLFDKALTFAAEYNLKVNFKRLLG
jgi:hypothetical protein